MFSEQIDNLILTKTGRKLDLNAIVTGSLIAYKRKSRKQGHALV